MDGTTTDEPKKPHCGKRESYTEKVTVRAWEHDHFITPVKDVPAFRWEIDGLPVFYVWTAGNGASAPKGSEITDQDGTVWIVGKSLNSGTGNTGRLCYVTQKPA